MKKLILLITVLLPILAFSQSPGDTIVIPTFNYSQTNSTNGRDSMILFPDGSLSYEKIILSYNMRCKDGNVSVPGNTNYGCGEWDYSCNTYITDSSRVDSVLNFQSSHLISHFSGETYEYVESPTFNYYQYLQKEVQLNSINSESQSLVGTGSLSLNNVIKSDEYSGKSQFLISQSELSSAGLAPGEIDGITIKALNISNVSFFKVRLKHTESLVLDNASLILDGFTEVYFADYTFNPGENRIQFYTPFDWDGISNIIIEFSFTNDEPENQLLIEGSETGQNMGVFANNGTHIINDMGYTEVPTGPFTTISEQITVSFWCFGSPEFLPAATSIVSGVDEDNNRNLNIHLPWSNSIMYFDCGYESGGYNRIEKAATSEEIAGKWNHWAFTKNATAGEMKIYLNGELWHSGTGLTKPINIQELVIGDISSGDRHYFGKIDEFRIWNAELNQSTIQEWMNLNVENTHPNYNNLVAYYKYDEGIGTSAFDSSVFFETAEIHDYVIWEKERGNDLSREFSLTTQRPNITFVQGDYDITITETIATVSVENIANVVTEYEIIPKYGTMEHDSINEVFTDLFWQSGYEYIFDPEGILIDSIEIIPTGTIELGELTYYKRYPSIFEIMSFVTPYGIYLDLGMEGKTWNFDITDYAPFLKGWKRLTMERGGQRQEDMDIKFLFIVGTPPRDVLDINHIWRPASSGYQSIMADRTFEARDVYMHPDGDAFKIRSVITGHGQQGEFTPRWHNIDIDGDEVEFEWQVWTECSTIPIYPQGGTWLYDRAGWCPGDPSDLYEYDITEYVTPGQMHNIDYTVTWGTGTSNYLISKQLVAYGPPNFDLDAAVINIKKPNAEIASWERFNPACSYPVIVIQNTGNTVLTDLDIEYYVEGGEILTYEWNGSLGFLETEEIELDIPNYTFWMGTDDQFNVIVSNPNGSTDEYPYNNFYSIEFANVDLYNVDHTFTIECKTNGQGYQTSYSLTDLEGNVILEMDNLENNTIYTNDVDLELGCYQLRIDDSGDNGLYYWHTPGFGSGYFRLKYSDGTMLENFEPEFGRFAIYEFGVISMTGNEELKEGNTVVSVYPNPTADQINFNILGFKGNTADFEVYNASMVKVLEDQFFVSTEDFTESISLHGLPVGIYFLRMEINEQLVLKKIVKK
jgi:hypothetical protein